MDDLILYGDVYAGLNKLENNSVALAITSPPYWKQRDYGFEGQIGQESSVEEYIGKLVAIFDELKEKLREDGVFFLNIGDKYLNKYGKSHLLQIPYRLAYHMIKNGWHLVDIIIWYKPNHMPASTDDRFVNTYEPVLVLAKNDDNVYRKNFGNVLKIPLQRTPWKHTAVFPERLVLELLNRANLKDGDLVLDPFAGTGTVATVVKNLRNQKHPINVYSIMIEKNNDFIDIIKKRANIKQVEKVNDINYEWKPVIEEKIPKEIGSKEILKDRYGEVFIADTSKEFLSALNGIASYKFKTFHREDALYFFGVKQWTISDLYYINSILYQGYVLRNMLVVSNENNWYPIFMFARNNTKVNYRFYIDRIRTKSFSDENINWLKWNFEGMKVNDITVKNVREGKMIKVLERYQNAFPKIAIVKWNDGDISTELVLNPNEDEIIMEGLKFLCPRCGAVLENPYDPIGENKCPNCGTSLWTDVNTLPKIKEPEEILQIVKKIKNMNYDTLELTPELEFEEKQNKTKSKFSNLDRINWGASPGARKSILGEYFTKMRLYKIDQPIIAQYFTVLRKHKDLSIQEIIERFPESYKHTVGHWFRRDFGGSIPLPEDLELLKQSLETNHYLFSILGRTALKFQTVKPSVKGKNPGDFIEGLTESELISYIRKLYMP